jgi:hypothetical protein
MQLIKLVDNLKTKIKKLETNKKIHNTSSSMITYKLQMPITTYFNSKKYVALLFNIHNSDNSNGISFIKLEKTNNIINYSIILKVDHKNTNTDNICSFSLGIRDDGNKIKIIKGSKVQYDVLQNTIDENIIINNTILYESTDNQELCLIASLSKKCTFINKKSIIKILHL